MSRRGRLSFGPIGRFEVDDGGGFDGRVESAVRVRVCCSAIVENSTADAADGVDERGWKEQNADWNSVTTEGTNSSEVEADLLEDDVGAKIGSRR